MDTSRDASHISHTSNISHTSDILHTSNVSHHSHVSNVSIPAGGEFRIDILDEQFAQYLQIAKHLMPKLLSPNDRQIAAKYISRCCILGNATHSSKSYRNNFFRYFLKVLDASIRNQQHYVQVGEPGETLTEDQKDVFRWSNDRRTYVATKIIPNYATLVYMAVCDDPEQGWDNGGFGCYEF
ncbi:uncharacterized protein LOC131686059 [Topomyia yanbarensis]|uniref:uncharacterized protein LOC131686059 n=1 Tax=Topomyia yanbarensis TaxID=2498891 RepID=UPI00273B95F7|nr:uncharacterized protein LOC131686059 [Topomyia yanbarensis]